MFRNALYRVMKRIRPAKADHLLGVEVQTARGIVDPPAAIAAGRERGGDEQEDRHNEAEL